MDAVEALSTDSALELQLQKYEMLTMERFRLHTLSLSLYRAIQTSES